MKKWVCTVCGYVYEGETCTGRMSDSVAYRLPSSKSRADENDLGMLSM